MMLAGRLEIVRFRPSGFHYLRIFLAIAVTGSVNTKFQYHSWLHGYLVEKPALSLKSHLRRLEQFWTESQTLGTLLQRRRPAGETA